MSNYFLRKDISCGWYSSEVHILPDIRITKTNKFIEITFTIWRLYLYLCYSINSYDDES